MATLWIAGKLEEFGHVFDLREWNSKEIKHLRRILTADGDFEREIREFADEQGFHFPLKAALGAKVARMKARAAARVKRHEHASTV
jgi:hypothetical protein